MNEAHAITFLAILAKAVNNNSEIEIRSGRDDIQMPKMRSDNGIQISTD